MMNENKKEQQQQEQNKSQIEKQFGVVWSDDAQSLAYESYRNFDTFIVKITIIIGAQVITVIPDGICSCFVSIL